MRKRKTDREMQETQRNMGRWEGEGEVTTVACDEEEDD